MGTTDTNPINHRAIRNGRWTPVIEEGDEYVMFLIGMRVNKVLALRQWVPVAAAMPKMLRELGRRPELGLLSARTFVSGRDVMVVQYWRSVDQLNTYARAAEHLHLPAWRAFNAAVRDSGTVGIWHETYRVRAGTYEAIYANMPSFGLGRAVGGAVPVRAGRQSAAARMDARQPDLAAIEPY